jgi:hypothetical protein
LYRKPVVDSAVDFALARVVTEVNLGTKPSNVAAHFTSSFTFDIISHSFVSIAIFKARRPTERR